MRAYAQRVSRLVKAVSTCVRWLCRRYWTSDAPMTRKRCPVVCTIAHHTIFCMMELSDAEKYELVSIYLGDYSACGAVDEFHRRHPDKAKPAPNTCLNIHRRLQQTGSVQSRKRGRRPVSAASSDKVHNVLTIVRGQPQLSVRKLEQTVGFSKSEVHRILQRENFHPYKFQTVQMLSETDKDAGRTEGSNPASLCTNPS